MGPIYRHFCSLYAVLVVYFMYVDCSESNINKCNNFMIPGCSCAPLGQIMGIMCNSDTDTSILTDSLDATFGVNEMYEITLENFASIPARVIQGLIVFRVIVDDPKTDHVSDEAFDGVIRLRWFHVYLSSLTVIPNFKAVSHSLREVNIDNSLLTRVQGEFQDLPLLTHLSLRNNSIESVQADAFKGTTAVAFVDLSYNRISSLPENVFDELNDIGNLILSYNQLYTVHGLFKNIGSKLRTLYLEFNFLADADDILQSHMPLLQRLSLSNNPLRNLSENTFNRKLPNLRFLYLSGCNLTQFGANHFKSLTILSFLDLSNNQIEHIRNETLDFGTDLVLVMNRNGMKTFTVTILNNVKSLFLRDNSLRSLGRMLQYSKLFEIDISRNRLVALEANDLHGCGDATIVSFRENAIERIDNLWFGSFRSIISSLDFSCNKLTSLNSSVHFHSELRVLIVSNNMLEALNYDEFKGLNQLSELYVENNKISAVKGDVLNVPNLKFLNLHNNFIIQLDMNQFPRTLEQLHIKGNQLKCNCQLYTLFLQQLRVTQLDLVPCRSTNASEDLPYVTCPSTCDCRCEREAGSSFLTADCSSRSLSSVPDAFNTRETPPNSEDALYCTSYRNFIIHDPILALNLSSNRIRSLDEIVFPASLKKLYLANNLLRTLPYSIMKLPKLQEVTLSGNKWTCDCDDGKAVQFRNWLLPEDRRIPDMNKTLCYENAENKVIVSASETDLCPRTVGHYLIWPLVALGLLILIVVLKIVYTRYKLGDRMFPFMKRVKLKNADEDKVFDAFLSFSNLDRRFIWEDVIPDITIRYPNIELYIPTNDWYAQDLTVEDIMKPVSISRRITFIVTKNFLEDERCVTIFRKAHDELYDVIVIKAGDLPINFDPELKVLVDKVTSLTWGEKYFWQKFVCLLPSAFGATPERRDSDSIVDV